MWVTFHGIELANKTLCWPDGGPRYRARLPTVILCYFPRESGLLGCFLLRLECLSLVFLPTGLRDINFSLEKGEGQRNQDFFFFPSAPEVISIHLLSVPLGTQNSS